MVAINTNVQAMNANRLINVTNLNLQKTTERLSSGLRINHASDDAAGVGIAAVLESQIRGGQAASNNIQMGINMLEAADGGLSQIGDMLQRMKELAAEANNSSLSSNQSTALDNEYQQLKTAIDNVANQTKFNNTNLLNAATTVTLQVGTSNTATATIGFTSNTSTSLGITAASSLTSQANASTAEGLVDTAINTLSSRRATLGAQESGLQFLKNSTDAAIVANADAKSHVTDADMALEVSNLVKYQILQQAGGAALSAANFQGQFVVSLLSSR